MAIQTDRLSDLPDNLLCLNILSHLSLKDAIRTSLLSHRWKTLWRNIPQIDFSQSFFDSLIKLTCRLAEAGEIKSSVKYAENVINNILSLHSTDLESVRIDVSIKGGQNRLVEKILNNVSIEQCIKGAAVKGVKKVVLRYRGMGGKQVPSSLFACELLRVLEIEGFWITKIPSDFGGFLSLKACFLAEVGDLTDARLQQLIAVCPLLEKLVIKRCAGLFNLQISAPHLSYLNLGTTSIENFTADCPQLVELKIKDCFMLCKFELNSFPFLQEMEASEISALEEIPVTKSLKKLSLRIGLDTPFGVLISTFPDLEELKITDILIQIQVQTDKVAVEVAYLQELLAHWVNALCTVARVLLDLAFGDRTPPRGCRQGCSSSARRSYTTRSQPHCSLSGGAFGRRHSSGGSVVGTVLSRLLGGLARGGPSWLLLLPLQPVGPLCTQTLSGCFPGWTWPFLL